MLLSFESLVRKYNIKAKGVLHIGGHWGEEYEDYKLAGIENIIFVEPCKEAFKIMTERINDHKVTFFNCACGEAEAEVLMHVSNQNEGQSNSLLKPLLHLLQHPEIKFTNREVVKLKRLDDLNFNKKNYSLLVMDVQGYEGEVLKGATETLKHIDYVYTEVNRDSVYENCVLIDELDLLLKDFKRVETKWAGLWGDSFYLRKTILN